MESNSFLRKDELITTLFHLQHLLFVIKAVFILIKLQSVGLEQHFGIFITILYDFEKQ